jgi:site-specific DNA recombinase
MTRTRNKRNESHRDVVRCAIYTRKSTEEGLDQEFNTLDAQRESGVGLRVAIWTAPPCGD